ncbi:2Fe-2S iron-sulfur cluster-binding protein [Ideonella azotifigens]|uniref:2Fe-2S iron-sulfur cluster-binding protein n=1 Tax=Ideonella azotifigens TaxID=513160 RepID=A0ABN1K4R3_9BURK|nr:2Fe-2S iron-sulfur cluster-binding protein [Ideonella azotifigens]MCD2344478.1 2Fe-2S iron-sulfur cluster-binding protein [Ideonella azotifigens]
MLTIHYLLSDGSRRSCTDAQPGSSVMENALWLNVAGIDAECGGACVCATCHVQVEEAFLAALPPPDDMERTLLASAIPGHSQRSRLSCQIAMTPALDGIVVHVPAH